MSTQITINGLACKGLDEFMPAGVVTAGNYYALPPLGVPPEVGEERFIESRVNIPARDNTGRVRSGFYSRPIWVDIILIDSLAGLAARRTNFLNKIKELQSYTITMPEGDAYQECGLMQELAQPTRENIASGYVAVVYHSICFEQLRRPA